MPLLILSFLVSLLTTAFLVRSAIRIGRLTDHDLSGPQKFHKRPVPRVGGIGIMAALVAGLAYLLFKQAIDLRSFALLVACSLPVFVVGIAEDLTKSVSPRRRLMATVVSAALAYWLLEGVVRRTHVPGFETLVQWAPFAFALTLFIIAGITHAINIIDGFNGLASMCVLMMVLAIAYVAYQVNDSFIFTSALIAAGAIFGFFVWNFPAGLIFLGDGGAYLIGFLLGELGILLVHRNPSVSPICPLLLCAYPVFETVFTMYRRKFVRGVATGLPDGIHLHTLIHRRLVRWTLMNNVERRRLTRRNSATSPYLWILCLTSVIPSVLWWNNTVVLTCFLFGFMAIYVWLYGSIVRFRTPRWMVFRRMR
jgi:UDP-N-acetylmuramyl pentapeptide phosphotransferase/UDP-N-acetylglucosamine-1-phosphate transferase